MRRFVLGAALALSMGLACTPARAQGCSMCRDTTAGSAPQMQRGLRRAIPILGVPAVVIFAGIVALVFRKQTS